MPSEIVPDNAIAAAAVAAGFPQSEIVTAVAVALAESGGNRYATNTNSNGSTDRGLFQINSIHTNLTGDVFDPASNARMAFQIWQAAGGKWTPWSVYNNGRYKMFVGRAQVAAKGSSEPGFLEGFASVLSPVPADSGANPIVEPLQALTAVSDFLSKAMNPKNWASIALIGLGGVILIVVAIKMVAQSNTAKKVGGVALSAVPGGGAVNTVLKKGVTKSAVDATKKAVAK